MNPKTHAACAKIMRQYVDDPETAHAAEDTLLWEFVRLAAASHLDEHVSVTARTLLSELGQKDRSRWYA